MAKFYVTTSIPYVNAPPHIGHALEFVQADAIARRERLREKEVFFLTGTDEHGLKNYRTAEALGHTPQEFVDENAAHFERLLAALGISNDFFIRTSDRAVHWPSAEKLWQTIERAGDIYKKNYHGWYCVGHESFHPESELESGECPSYPGKKLELVEEENYFFRLSKYAPELTRLIEANELHIIPEGRKNEILSLIERGLEDVSFSRPKEKLPWGIPVPEDDSHMMYVWCDALANYLSGLNYAEAGAQFQKFWPPDLHVIGKDILRFHAAIWPAMLLSAKLPLPKTLFVHGFLTVGGEKMSKSVGNVIDPTDLISRYGADPVRYFLFREIPATEDGDFTEEKLKERYNADLANGLGNLLSRVLAIGERYAREIPLRPDDLGDATRDAWRAYDAAFDRYQFHDALAAIWGLIGKCDRYLNETEPWKLPSGDELARVLSSSGLALANIAWMLKPILPGTADKIINALNLDSGKKEPWQGRAVLLKKLASPLFPRKE